MKVYETLLSQIKDNNFKNAANFNEQKLGNSSFDDVFDKLKDMLGQAQNLNEKFKNISNDSKATNEQINALSSAIDEAKASIDALGGEQKDDLAATFKKLEEQAKKDDEMFKTFDFMQLMNQLIYGSNDEDEKNKIYQKMQEIAKSVK